MAIVTTNTIDDSVIDPSQTTNHCTIKNQKIRNTDPDCSSINSFHNITGLACKWNFIRMNCKPVSALKKINLFKKKAGNGAVCMAPLISLCLCMNDQKGKLKQEWFFLS